MKVEIQKLAHHFLSISILWLQQNLSYSIPNELLYRTDLLYVLREIRCSNLVLICMKFNQV